MNNLNNITSEVINSRVNQNRVQFSNLDPDVSDFTVHLDLFQKEQENKLKLLNERVQSRDFSLSPKTKEPGLIDKIAHVVEEVNSSESKAKQANEDYLAGRTNDLHGVMIKQEKASILLDLVLQTRKKALEAYNEVKGMQV